jgi:hypothetical protein
MYVYCGRCLWPISLWQICGRNIRVGGIYNNTLGAVKRKFLESVQSPLAFRSA